MYYGSFEPVNYLAPAPVKAARGKQKKVPPATPLPTLEYTSDLPAKPDKSAIVDTVFHNWTVLQQSLMRLGQPPQLYRSLPPLSRLPGLQRRALGVWLHDLFPGVHSHPAIWERNAARLFKLPRLQWVLGQIVSQRRMFGVCFTHAPRERLTAATVELFLLWTVRCGHPLPVKRERRYTGLNLFVFTSSLAGKTAKAKRDYLLTLPKQIRPNLCLVADDLSVEDTVKLANVFCCQASYDFAVHRLTLKDPVQVAIRATWNGSVASSGFDPYIFVSKPIAEAKRERIIRHFAGPRKIQYTSHTVKDAKIVPGKTRTVLAHWGGANLMVLEL